MIKPNSWYRTRGGGIAYVLGFIPPSSSNSDTVLGVLPSGMPASWQADGAYVKSEESSSDLIEHLPGCTGFDWVPEPEYTPLDFDDIVVGSCVRYKVTGAEMMITGRGRATPHARVAVNGNWISAQALYLEYSYLDLKPCGKVPNER